MKKLNLKMVSIIFLFSALGLFLTEFFIKQLKLEKIVIY